MSNFLQLAQTLQMTIKALQMYTPTHPRAVSSLQSLAVSVKEWLQEQPSLHMAATNGKVFVDGAPVEGQTLHLQAIAKQLTERQIAGFVIQRGVEEEELLGMLQLLILKPAKLEEMGGVAKAMAGLNLRHITLSQTQYREVREGDGGEESQSQGPPATIRETPLKSEDNPAALAAQIQSASTPLVLGLATALRQWKVQLLAASEQLGLQASGSPSGGSPAGESAPGGTGRYLGRIPAADLSGLGTFARETGWTDEFPTELQLESLKQAIMGLPAETRLSVLKGQSTAPASPAGLQKGLEALSPELFGGAATELVAQGVAWKSLRENLFDILLSAPGKQQSMMADFEAGLRQQGLDMACIQDLMKRLEWETQTLDGRIQMVLVEGRLWELNMAQRLELLRELLDQGRMDPFMRILEEVTTHLTVDDPRIREFAAQTLSVVARWTIEPGLPLEAEGLIQTALTAHFGWEPALHIHRSTEESIAGLLSGFLKKDDPVRAQTLLQELNDLCEFLEDRQEWRLQALARLKTRLTSDEMMNLSTASLHRAEASQVLTLFVPYFEFLGEPAAQWFVKVLGEEPDRKRRGRLLEIIRGLGPVAMPALEDGLHSPTWHLVRNTLNLLADMGDADLLGNVARCLDHADGRVRRAAVRALWKLGGPASAPHLLSIFQSTDPDTQLEILFGLSQVQSAEAAPVLGEFTRNAQAPLKIRMKTAETLGHIGNPAAIPFLVDVIRRRGRIFTSAEPLELRLAAAQALVAIATPPALEALRKLVADEPRGQEREALARLVPPVAS